jgi:hypothetical protein
MFGLLMTSLLILLTAAAFLVLALHAKIKASVPTHFMVPTAANVHPHSQEKIVKLSTIAIQAYVKTADHV